MKPSSKLIRSRSTWGGAAEPEGGRWEAETGGEEEDDEEEGLDIGRGEVGGGGLLVGERGGGR